MDKCINQEITDNYALYNGDACELIRQIPSASIGYSIFSPPFAQLFSYSDSDRDLGNCKDYDEFFEHFSFLIDELFRVMKSGRILSVHCQDIRAMKSHDGYIGLKDFPGDLTRAFQNSGFIYHSKHVIWKDPLREFYNTKSIGLQYSQLCKDGAMVRAGIPDYLVSFRKSGENDDPVTHPDGIEQYHGSADIKAEFNHAHFDGEGEPTEEDEKKQTATKRRHNIWRAYASPVWMDIRQTNTLNRGPKGANDQKHICPLQLDVIERAIQLWSKPGDVVLTPFGGIGSEAYVAVKNKRRAILIELKESYYRQAVKNIKGAIVEGDNLDLFQYAETESTE